MKSKKTIALSLCQEKEGREGEAASQPDHLWDSQLGRLSGVHQTLGVTPEPAGSVSHASELAHAPCSSLSPDTGSDPPLVRAGMSGKVPGKGGPSPQICVRSGQYGKTWPTASGL